MADFFYLGGRETPNNNKHEENPRAEKYLYKNEEIYSNKGFEIWPQQYFPINNNNHNNYGSFGAGPSSNNGTSNNLRTRSLYFGGGGGGGGDDDELPSARSGFTIMKQVGGGGMNCQDCGNQAKKDCSHMRCRTCCKSRGFNCVTHVKSTWVPAAKRRERQQQLSALSTGEADRQHQQQVMVRFEGEQSKRQREITNTGLEVGHFPPEVNSPAIFRCVKVSAMDDAEAAYAYQTAVNIGGHTFKGILYDQGLESRYNISTGADTSHQHNQQQPLNLITEATTTTAGAVVDNLQYPPPLNAFIAGTFFPHPRS